MYCTTMNIFEKKLIKDKLIILSTYTIVFLLNLSEMCWKKQILKRKRNPLDKNSKIWKNVKEQFFHSFSQF